VQVVERKILKVLAYIKKYKLVDNALLFTSLFTAMIAFYLSSFNISTFMLLDATTVGKFFITLTFSFILASTIVSIFLPWFQYSLLAVVPEKFHTLIENDFSKLKPVFKLIIFLFFYVGIKNTGYVMAQLIFISLLFLAYDIMKAPKIFIEGTKLPDLYQVTMKYFKEKKYRDLFFSNISVLLLIFSISMGIGRAYYIKDHSIVTINNTNQEYILFMTTDYGVNLYDKKDDKVTFISWDNITNMTFKNKSSKFIFL